MSEATTITPESIDDNCETDFRVIGICGSLRPKSYTKIALAIALQGAREVGVETELVDLGLFALPFCDGSRAEASLYPEVARLRNIIKRSCGVILATPEYHGSVSGVLKNALDLMGFQEFEGKMMGLVSVSGGALGGVNALNDLRNVGRALHAWVVPEQASVAEAYKVFDESGHINDPRVEQRLKAVGKQVAQFGRLHTPQHVNEFLRLWEEAPVNPGGDAK